MRAEPEKSECQCCGFKEPVGGLEEYHVNTMGMAEKRGEKHQMLCSLCSCTYTSVAADFPGAHDVDKVMLMQTMCYIGNQLRKDIAAKSGGGA